MTTYHKIMGPFLRHTEGPNRNKIIPWAWSTPEFEKLAELDWYWTEKIDGTNIRVVWDGNRVVFGGKSDNAQIPAKLLDHLRATFPEELLEQQFGSTPAVLYGEGFGPKIQKVGHLYGEDQKFILFDVKVGDWWLLPINVFAIANQLGIPSVPYAGSFDVYEAIRDVNKGIKSSFGDFYAEGLVGRPPLGITSRTGDRMLMKVKHADLHGVDLIVLGTGGAA